MDRLCFALPILPGKTADARSFQRELDGPRKGEYRASGQRIGVMRAYWFLQASPRGDLFLVYLESPDCANALGQLAASQDEFDQWFKRRLADATGVDLSNPPPGLRSEMLASYQATSGPPAREGRILHV